MLGRSGTLALARALACTLACTLGAAGPGACAQAARRAPQAGPAATRVVVRNYSWHRVTVYVARRGTVTRIGDLEPFHDLSLPAPRWAQTDADAVHFIARPLAGGPFVSELFTLPRGAVAVWTIENQPSLSHVVLR